MILSEGVDVATLSNEQNYAAKINSYDDLLSKKFKHEVLKPGLVLGHLAKLLQIRS